jgi:ATP-binding protein involved in chromosome partitioning
MAHKVDLDVVGVVENMSGFDHAVGERFPIFGEGGGRSSPTSSTSRSSARSR